MKKIPLSQGKFALVDDEDFENVNRFKWYFANGYARRTPIVNGKRTTLSLHRFIMNAKPEEMIDHVNGDKLDNRRENLRFCTPGQNQMNIKKRVKNTICKYKGVYKYQPKGRKQVKYQAVIRKDGKKINLGYFNSEEMAARAYNDAAIIHFGEFANLNDVPKRRGEK